MLNRHATLISLKCPQNTMKTEVKGQGTNVFFSAELMNEGCEF